MLVSSTCPPDSITLRSVLRACSQCHYPELTTQLHCYMVKVRSGFSPDQVIVLNTCLLNGYMELGRFDIAREVFDRIPERDVVAWTSMLRGYVEGGDNEEAMEVFEDMVGCGDLVMNEYVYSCALRACARMCCFFGGKQMHGRVVKSMMDSDVFVGTGLVDLYAKCDDMESAMKAFLGITDPNVVSYNALLAGNLKGNKVLPLLTEMRLLKVNPDQVTFACALRACKDDISVCSLKQLHGLIMKTMEVELDMFLSCALFEAYINMGCIVEAQKVFGRMEEKDDAAFNLAIQGYLRNGLEAKAFECFTEALKMRKNVREVNATSLLMNGRGLDQGKQLHAFVVKFGSCDTSIVGSLVKMYANHHCIAEAIQLFDQIPSPDIVLWTDLISNFSHCGEYLRALTFYVKMLTDGAAEPPNNYTFSTLLRSCAHLAAALEGKQIHGQIIKSNLSNIELDPFVASALLFMYSRCGYIEESRRLFKDMPEKDLASWNAMITSLAHHGLGEEAIETFKELLNQKDIEPNDITFVGVLTACSHEGMIDLGIQYFQVIKQPTIDHYACVISLFARAGLLKEALDLVEEMPFEANEIIWSSLLAASSTYANVELGEYSAKKLLELDPKDPGTYVTLSNIYAAARRWEDMRRIRKLMKSQVNRKHLAVSWLRVNGIEHTFTAA
ncbi:pentatricopeptide repeat-containing protein At2g33680-like [Asparagus officinalis]|uniref:pentatricopeptide repeat-containing protein At2g33680-like n=1 Tax=Asparagus officinalis TaxID=4686 RepID=UPI00098E5391|nr:pentatricopeptide repeat-containing protein At2g33680-like [Asparagus officinalis]